MRHGVLLTAGLMAAAVAVSMAAPVGEPVRLDSGLVTGVAGRVSSDVRVFKGIPFAAPPVGERRWRAPQPPAAWTGVREAAAFAANCMQRAAGGGAFPPYGGDRTAARMSEDCLYLNVYTTAASARDKQPVMVWIHGGALTSGAGAIYQGEDLARKGVVVVTINYRLGVFGFLAHPELTANRRTQASGNYGLLDQIAALQWVQRNIAAFGGDPARVTIFGESAGSWSVNYLMASPLAKGLFHRAIGESGGEFAPGRSRAEAEQAGVEFARAAGADSIAALREMSAEQVAAAPPPPAAANVDGWLLPDDVYGIFKNGRQNDVPLLIGSNSDEGSIFTPASVTAATFQELVRRRYRDDADAYLALYPFDSDQQARAAQAASMRDQTFGWEMRTWARLHSLTGSAKVYLYYFSHVPPLANAAWLGAQHGAEIPYALNWPNGAHSREVAWTDNDRQLAATVSSYWVNFAASGNPNGRGLPEWPPYQAKVDRAMTFGDRVAVLPLPTQAGTRFSRRIHGAPAGGQAHGGAGRTVDWRSGCLSGQTIDPRAAGAWQGRTRTWRWRASTKKRRGANTSCVCWTGRTRMSRSTRPWPTSRLPSAAGSRPVCPIRRGNCWSISGEPSTTSSSSVANPAYEELTWPDDYWPSSPAPASDIEWEESIRLVRSDRAELARLASDPQVSLTATIPHGQGQTYLRELVLVADHTAYHLGELIVVRRLLGIWPTA